MTSERKSKPGVPKAIQSDSLAQRPSGQSISIVLISWGRRELTLSSIESIGADVGEDAELILVGEKDFVLEGDCSKLIRVDVSPEASFAERCNAGARVAHRANLLFVKEGIQVRPGSIASTIECLERSEVGAVGAMLIDSNGVLLEAGSLLFDDGRCHGFGRGWNPDDFRVQYRRAVAFCSAAYLATRKSVFEAIGGFDEAFENEYYEDVDYCLKLARKGRETIYDPESVAVWKGEHRSGWEAASVLMESNRSRFIQIWSDALASLPKRDEWDGQAVFERAKGDRVLWIEDSPPFAHMGAGFPRTREMLSVLLEMGRSVTLLPTFITSKSFEDVYSETPREVEVALGIGESGFREFWKLRSQCYDAVIVSRPNNLRSFYSDILDTKSRNPSLRFVYDAEAVFVNREINERRLNGEPFSEGEERRMLEEELGPALKADSVFAVSETERSQFESLCFDVIHMLRHYSELSPTAKGFEQRKDILFVGAVHADTAPNALGLIWFIEEVLPLIRKELGSDLKLYFAGRNGSEALAAYASESEVFLGFVEDLDEWYDRCRVFIAPARFAAGIPLKVIEAASRGIPVVAASLAREQLGWTEGEMLSANDAQAYANECIRAYTDESLWQGLRSSAIDRLEREYSRDGIERALRAALD